MFNIERNRTAEVSRRQFPLVLAWATLIHKVQGLTLNETVVDMKDVHSVLVKYMLLLAE